MRLFRIFNYFFGQKNQNLSKTGIAFSKYSIFRISYNLINWMLRDVRDVCVV